MGTVSHSVRGHAVCSASSASRWLACPGSVGMCQEAPPPPQSPYAEEGTRAHELAERILRRWEKDGRALDLVWVDSLRPEYADTEEQRESGTWSMVDYVLAYVHACLEHVQAFDAPPGVQVESRLVLDASLEMFGTVDFVASGTIGGVPTGLIVDLKYGRGVRVRAEGNPQLAYYAAALLGSSRRGLKRVKAVIVQPRIDEWLSDALFTAEELGEWRQKLVAGARVATEQARTTLYELAAGPHCRFCAAKAVCGPHLLHLQKEAALDFADPPELAPSAEVPAAPAAPSPFLLTPEKVAAVLRRRDDIRRFLDALEGFALGELQAGRDIPGFKLVRGRSRRRWRDDPEAVAAELQRRGLADPWRRELVTLTAAERALGGPKAIEDLVVKPEAALTLVAADDPRPALGHEAAADFLEVTVE